MHRGSRELWGKKPRIDLKEEAPRLYADDTFHTAELSPLSQLQSSQDSAERQLSSDRITTGDVIYPWNCQNTNERSHRLKTMSLQGFHEQPEATVMMDSSKSNLPVQHENSL